VGRLLAGQLSAHRLSLLIWALALAGACGCASPSRPVPHGEIPRGLLLEARPIGRGARFHPPVTGRVGSHCQRRIGRRFGVHVELFAVDRVVIVPAGIGVRPPVRQLAGRIVSARCYGRLVTLEPTGLVLVRAGAALSLSDLFGAWGEPLSRRQMASFRAARGSRVSVFLDGREVRSAPGDLALSRHAEIVLEVGPHVPPHSSYTFPPGT